MHATRYITTKITKDPIIITSNAWQKIGKILDISRSNEMLFSAKGGGCNGFNYSLELLNSNFNIDPNAITLSKNNYKVIIDPLSEIYLIGTTIDYQKEDFQNQIYDSKFLFLRNKKDVSLCGCGISFVPKNIN